MSGQRPRRGIRKSSRFPVLSNNRKVWGLLRTENQKRSLDPENHSQQAWWRAKRNRSRRRNVRLGMSQAELGNLCGGNLLRKSVSGTRGCGYALRPLPEAAAMLFLARQTAGSELEQSYILGVAKPRTTRMACWHCVVVSALVLSHFTRCMHVPGMHEDHRRHDHLCPSHHGYKQRRRNGFLHHAPLGWQSKSGHDVTAITSIPGLSHQIRKSRLQLGEAEFIPAGPEFARLDPLAGQQ